MSEMSSVIHLGVQSILQRFSMCAGDVLCYTSRLTVHIAKVVHVCLRCPLLYILVYSPYCKGSPCLPEMSSVIHLGVQSILQRFSMFA